ncbi:MAG: SGNH/GDSL hydrolase family protein [Clostridiales bacterium]|jgi:hypothetical protein|nr:SGNH/GDSL hydrolase family protein [Clostridiales bacterium]
MELSIRSKIIRSVSFALILAIIFLILQQLFAPKYMDGVYEGKMVKEYYDETLNHDVIFIGDCEVYENFSPIALWEEYGIASYIRGGPQQLIWQSYYILEETLEKEKPAIAVFNVLAMQYPTPQKEPYNRLNLEGMNWSAQKLNSIAQSMTEGETLLSYVFPLLRYHDRWMELSAGDIKHFLNQDDVSFNGYLMRSDVKPVGMIPEGRKLPDYRFGENSYRYLDKILSLCKSEGVELILIKAPSIYPYWHPQWEEQMEEYARANDVKYINFLELSDETGIDLATDTYDAGLHLNVYGAEKAARYLGKILVQEYGLASRKEDPEYLEAWTEKCEEYYSHKAVQEREFQDDGKIKTMRR